MDEEEEEEEPIDDETIDRHIAILSTWHIGRSRSRQTRSETLDIQFRDWTGGRRPHNFLELLIARLLARILAGRPAPMYIGFGLEPPGWTRGFYIPHRPPHQNTPAAIAAALERFLADYDGVDIFDGSCRTKVSAIWPLQNVAPPNNNNDNNNNNDDDNGPMGACAPDLNVARAAAGGIARCQSWVPIVNPNDTLCLARAIVAGLADRRHRQQHQPNAHFRLWCETQRGDPGRQLAVELLTMAHVRVDLPMYGLPHAQRIQRWLNERLGGPQHVRIICLDRERGWRVAWKAPDRAHFNLVLTCVNHHWSYIQRPEQLFRVGFRGECGVNN